MFKTAVNVSFQLEAFHNWPDAGGFSHDVEFLQDRHRHMFHFKAWKNVTHDDRDVEIIMLKRQMQDYLKVRYAQYRGDQIDPLQYTSWLEFGSQSCEMIAKELVKRFGLSKCEVSEDGENGATVEWTDEPWADFVFVSGYTACGKNRFIENRIPSDYHKIITSDHVRSVKAAIEDKIFTTEELNDSVNLDKEIALSIALEIKEKWQSGQRKFVIDGVRQLSILKELMHFANQTGASHQEIWLQVPFEERKWRYSMRNRKGDLIPLSEIDALNKKLGIDEVHDYIKRMNTGKVIEN